MVGNNINPATAQANASYFLKHKTQSPTLKSATAADLQLAHAQKSSTTQDAHAYYAYNIKGGGFIIVAGEDRAEPILGYSDQGHLDFNNMPENLQALLRSYQKEIEFIQAHPTLDVKPAIRDNSGQGVEPLIKSHWGQEMPYNLQCPTYQGERCVVGCVATSMTQIMHYWQYPTSSDNLPSYYCYDIGQTVGSLPATNFEYRKMLNSYCHWDWDNSTLVQDTYTDEQAQAVAKLARYCGQAVQMGYSPEGSGAYTSNQLSAMQDFGYTDADLVSRDGSWWSGGYTTAQWEAMVKAELDAGRPMLYSANDYAAGGHAFVCDGYNSEGLLHFNFGWYGTCDGWYVSNALNMTHRDGDELHFNYGHEMIKNLEPPTYCLVESSGISVPSGLLFLGENMDFTANGITIRSSYDAINLLFCVCDNNDQRLAMSAPVNVVMSNFEQGSDMSSALTLPTTLEQGSYPMRIFYTATSSQRPTLVNTELGYLNVAGHLAKYNAPFTIEDVTTTISGLLSGSHESLTIEDVTVLISILLAGQH